MSKIGTLLNGSHAMSLALMGTGAILIAADGPLPFTDIPGAVVFGWGYSMHRATKMTQRHYDLWEASTRHSLKNGFVEQYVGNEVRYYA